MEINRITIPVGDNLFLKANLIVPVHPTAFVILSQGSGSSRFNRRNNYVAEILNEKRIATLVADLLTEDEYETYENRCDIDLLTQRLITVTNFISKRVELQKLKFGYMCSSTGTAAALKAATQLPKSIAAIVSRGGQPDLRRDILIQVKAPTLLIVGNLDYSIIELNENTYSMLQCEKKLKVVNGATHLFEETQLNECAKLAVDWFSSYLQPCATARVLLGQL